MSYDKRVENDLHHSQHLIIRKGFTFVFSSIFNLKRFEVATHSQALEMKLKSQYNVTLNLTKYTLFRAYQDIEKRGFLVYDMEGNEIWQKSLEYVGEVQIHYDFKKQ
jgi:hypothetical protein